MHRETSRATSGSVSSSASEKRLSKYLPSLSEASRQLSSQVEVAVCCPGSASREQNSATSASMRCVVRWFGSRREGSSRTTACNRGRLWLRNCCNRLETEVPLLVYEFISNGTLYQYLHDPNQEFHVAWDTRLQIAIEIAGALFYLHSAASIPIYHRDIKSTNILLDEKYRAKVADFGTSKSVSLDQTHVTTLVQGTFGYLDPEYFQSSQFTDKSDVYSFGVILVELLTGQKPISSLREQERRSLATYFIISMEQNCLFDIVDAQVLKEGKKEDISSVANLVKR